MIHTPLYETKAFKDELADLLTDSWRDLDMVAVHKHVEKAMPDLLAYAKPGSLKVTYAPPYLMRLFFNVAASNGKIMRANCHYFYSPRNKDGALIAAQLFNPYNRPDAQSVKLNPEDLNLYHPHPWAGCFNILEGMYKQAIGQATQPGVVTRPPYSGFKLQSANGDNLYAFNDPFIWHMVIPEGVGAVCTLMTTYITKDWPQKIPPPTKKNPELYDPEIAFVRRRFQTHYPKLVA